mmetsp:Transcript_22826/g.73927  ORF Transcript_22826/g.73927 Transcript_22826/m.73927 type:complete len:315 (+) Transcript_22826:520-1464(+)
MPLYSIVWPVSSGAPRSACVAGCVACGVRCTYARPSLSCVHAAARASVRRAGCATAYARPPSASHRSRARMGSAAVHGGGGRSGGQSADADAEGHVPLALVRLPARGPELLADTFSRSRRCMRSACHGRGNESAQGALSRVDSRSRRRHRGRRYGPISLVGGSSSSLLPLHLFLWRGPHASDPVQASSCTGPAPLAGGADRSGLLSEPMVLGRISIDAVPAARTGWGTCTSGIRKSWACRLAMSPADRGRGLWCGRWPPGTRAGLTGACMSLRIAARSRASASNLLMSNDDFISRRWRSKIWFSKSIFSRCLRR